MGLAGSLPDEIIGNHENGLTHAKLMPVATHTQFVCFTGGGVQAPVRASSRDQ